MLQLPPLSLYVHIPWCVRKCPYCDFNSHQADSELPEAQYVKALIEDLQESVPLAQGRALHSIFFGGGTPSLFSPQGIDDILTAAATQFGFEAGIEITMEANPGTFEQKKFTGFRQAGVNRLSIGVQSFNDLQLQALGRIHGSDEAINAVTMARQAGFDNINLDLMHGLPGQSLKDAERDLQQAIDLQTEHLSWYQLTIEPNTEFYSRPPELPIEDALADIQDAGEILLATNGFQQYEVSAYAQAGRRSAHNLNYWQFGDYLGVGAGAHGKTTLLAERTIRRTQKTRAPKHYLDPNKPFLSADYSVTESELPLEFMMNALRLHDGVAIRLFSARTGLPWSAVEHVCRVLEGKGLLQMSEGRLAVTPVGHRYLNEVLAAFMVAQA